MNIILTGATGFVGSHFREYCESLGDSVLSVGREVSDSCAKKINIGDQDLIRIVERFEPDVIVDLATHFDLSPIKESTDSLVLGSFSFHIILSNLLKAFDIPWVYSSSHWQYLRKDDGSYISDYHFLKSSIENYLSAAHYGNFQSIVLMDTYGETDHRLKIVKILMQLQKSDPIMGLSGGDQFLNLLHVMDVCTGIHKVCDNLISGLQDSKPQYLISSNFVTLKQLVKEVESIRKVKLPIRWGEKPYRVGEILEIPTISNLVPRWKQSIELNEGLARFL